MLDENILLTFQPHAKFIIEDNWEILGVLKLQTNVKLVLATQ